METGGKQTGFIVSVSPEELRKEKEKARDLRKSQWWKRQLAKGACYYCQRRLPPGELTMDHIVPLIRGGRSTRGNTVPACKDCNSRKRYLLPIEWDRYIRRVSKELPPESQRPESGSTKD
jgi:5-methylcytosine-specific restriction protein A